MSIYKKRVLVVDDDKEVRTSLMVYLKKYGYEVEEAVSGEAAAAIFQERGLRHGINLIIIDQVMQGIDGLTTFQKIKKMDGRLPAIMLTESPSVNVAIRFIQMGGINFLTKPFEMQSNNLALFIQEALNYKRVKRAQAAAVQGDPADLLVFRNGGTEIEAKTSEITCNYSPWKVLIVDDDKAVHGATRLVLETLLFDGFSLEFLSAYSASEAISCLDDNPDVALVLVDTVMETDFAGFDVIKHIRQTMGDRLIRIILRADQAGELPEQKVVLDHDIDGFLTKQNISCQRLAIMVTTTFRTYRDLLIIEKQRQKKVTEFENIRQEEKILQVRIKELEVQLAAIKPLEG